MRPLPPLFLSFLLTQLYAMLIHYPPPRAGLLTPHSLYVFKALSYFAGFLAFRPIVGITPTLTFISPPAEYVPGVLDAVLYAAAVGCLVGGEALFVWTAWTTTPGKLGVIYSKGTPGGVITHGPFKYVRHPTYTSYALGWVGTALGTAQGLMEHGEVGGWRMWGLGACLGGLGWCYLEGAKVEEEQFLDGGEGKDGLGAEYRRYCEKTPARWIPGIA